MKTGVVILGHGSRAAVGEANEIIMDIAAQVKQGINLETLEVAFMNGKSQRQNLGEAIGKVVAQGADRVIIAPLFITNGLHIREDIPAEIEEAKERYGEKVEIILARYLGADPKIAEIVTERIKEVF